MTIPQEPTTTVTFRLDPQIEDRCTFIPRTESDECFVVQIFKEKPWSPVAEPCVQPNTFVTTAVHKSQVCGVLLIRENAKDVCISRSASVRRSHITTGVTSGPSAHTLLLFHRIPASRLFFSRIPYH